MRSSFLRIAVASVVFLLVIAAVPGSGEDFLIIKKKGGPTQKVPLEFSPEQIESFKVESGPSARPSPDGEEEGPPAGVPQHPGIVGPSEPGPKALQIRPGTPTAPPSVLREAPGTGLRRDFSPGGPVEQVLRKEQPPAPVKKPVAGPVSAEPPRAMGSFYINVYELPDQVKTLPDFSAFRPKLTLNSDKINLDPARGDMEPAGLPDDTQSMGMRATGLFMVSGEGIFQWRVYSKDGVRLHIDDKTVLENDGVHPASSKTAYVHLAEGAHTIVLDTFNGKGQPVVKLLVTPPLGDEQVFSIKTGLTGWKEPAKPYDVLWGQVYFVPRGNYPNGPDFSKISPIGRLIAPALNLSGGDTIPGLPGRKDMVGIRYEGYFNVEGAGIFAFRLSADYFARLRIGDKEIAEVTGGMKANPEGKVGWAFLQKGSYPISVEYFHPQGQPRLELFVTQPQKPEETFAPAQTFHGFSAEESEVSQIPAFVYFLKPGVKQIPNYNKLSPAGMFFTSSINYAVDRGTREFPGVPKRDEWLGLRFYVKFTLSEAESGEYKFRVVCRDAARLIIGKNQVINADGIGKTQEKSGSVNLQPGSHEMFVDFMQTTGPDGIQLYITPPGGEEKIFAFQ